MTDNDPMDRDLRRRFAAMRTEDAADLPEQPDARTASGAAASTNSRGPGRALLGGAVAASIVVAALVLVGRQPTGHDPAALYAEIMHDYEMATDELLYVSAGASPEMTSVPEIVAPQLPGDISELVN